MGYVYNRFYTYLLFIGDVAGGCYHFTVKIYFKYNYKSEEMYLGRA